MPPSTCLSDRTAAGQGGAGAGVGGAEQITTTGMATDTRTTRITPTTKTGESRDASCLSSPRLGVVCPACVVCCHLPPKVAYMRSARMCVHVPGW